MAKQEVIFQLRVEDIGLATRIEQTRQSIRDLNKEIRSNPGPERFREISGELSKNRRELAELLKDQRALNREFNALRVPKDSLAGLRLEYAKLAREVANLSAADRATEFGRNLVRDARRTKEEIDRLEASIGRFTGNVGNYQSALNGLGRAFAALGIGVSVNEILGINTKIADSIANVAKTAGITVKEAQRLSDVLEFRDTRTSLADQLKIAEIGGQLGIASNQLESFTSKVDVLNVALGSDFGNVEELTRVVTSLRNVFTDFQTGDVSEDILKIGNALNFLEAQGVATAPVIAEFSGRIAGAAVPLGISTKQVIGLSTALGELAINPERGATAVSQLFLKIAQEPEKFAKVAGKSAKDFKKLVEEDLFGALQLVAEGTTKGAVTNVQFAKTLDELGVGRQGAIEVLGKLGGNIELLKTRTEQAGQALGNTDSVFQEFEKKNNNAAAAVEKLQNAVVNLVASEGAQDAIEAVAKAVTNLVTVFGDSLEIISENKAEFLALGAAIFAMVNPTALSISAFIKLQAATNLTTVAGLKNVVATGAQTVATGAQAVATRVLAAAQAALPLLALVAGIYLVVKAIQDYNAGFTAAEKASRAVSDAQSDIAQSSAAEISALTTNLGTIRSATATTEQRAKAIQELTDKYPEYLKGINLETQSAAQLAIIQQELTDQIIKQAAARAKSNALAEISGKIIEKELKIADLQRAQAEGKFSFQDREFIIANEQNKVKALRAELDETGKKFDEVFKLNQKPDSRVLTIVDPKSLNQQAEAAKKGAEVITDDEKKAAAKAAKERKKRDDDEAKRIQDQQQRIREIQKSIRDLEVSDEEGFSVQLQKIENDRIDALDKNAERLQKLRASVKAETGQEAPTTTGGIRQLPNAKPADITEADLIDAETTAINGAFDRQRAELFKQRKHTADEQQRQLEALLREANNIAAENEVKSAELAQGDIAKGFAKQREGLKKQFEQREDLRKEQLIKGQITQADADQQQLADQIEFTNRAVQIEQDYVNRITDIVNQVRDVKIFAAKQALEAELAAIEDNRLKDVAQVNTDVGGGTISAPQGNDKIAAINQKSASEAEAAQIKFADTVQRTTDEATNSQMAAINSLDAARAASHDAELGRLAEEGARRKQVISAAIDTAGEIAGALVQIQQNRLQQETEAELTAVEQQYQKKIDAAQGNAKLQAKLQKELAAKKEKIQKEAAEKEKKLAIISAIINTAVAVTKALTSASPPVNFILAALSLAAGIAQIAVIESQQFAAGGFTDEHPLEKSNKNRVARGKGRDTKTAVYPSRVWGALPSLGGGGYTGGGLPYTDSTGRRVAAKLPGSGAVLHAGEYVSPHWQVQKFPELFRDLEQDRIRGGRPFAAGGFTGPLFSGGSVIFPKMGRAQIEPVQIQGITVDQMAGGGFTVPGAAKIFYLRPFAGGGFVEPLIGLPNSQELKTQSLSVKATASFTDEQVSGLGTIIAAEIARQIKPALAEGLSDANRRLERESALDEQRTF